MFQGLTIALHWQEGFAAFDVDADNLISQADLASSATRFNLGASALVLQQLHAAMVIYLFHAL